MPIPAAKQKKKKNLIHIYELITVCRRFQFEKCAMNGIVDNNSSLSLNCSSRSQWCHRILSFFFYSRLPLLSQHPFAHGRHIDVNWYFRSHTLTTLPCSIRVWASLSESFAACQWKCPKLSTNITIWKSFICSHSPCQNITHIIPSVYLPMITMCRVHNDFEIFPHDKWPKLPRGIEPLLRARKQHPNVSTSSESPFDCTTERQLYSQFEANSSWFQLIPTI